MIYMKTVWIPSYHPEGSALLWVARPSEQCRPCIEIHDSGAVTKVCMLFVCFACLQRARHVLIREQINAKEFSQACFSLVKPVIGMFKFTMSQPLDKLCDNRLALCDHASGSSFVCIRGFAAKLVWVYKSGLERTRRTRINEALCDCRYSWIFLDILAMLLHVIAACIQKDIDINSEACAILW